MDCLALRCFHSFYSTYKIIVAMKWIRNYALAAMILSAASVAEAQDATPCSMNPTVGFELDALPYLSNGWYFSGWVGFKQSQIRLRPIIAKSDVPSFMLDSDFKKNTLRVNAFVVDYFFKPDFKGFWIGTGFEQWNGKITTKEVLPTYENWIVPEQSMTKSYKSYVFTLGGGYVWKIYKNLYLNPWVAGHLKIGGENNVAVGSKVFKPSRFIPEASLKLGWHF